MRTRAAAAEERADLAEETVRRLEKELDGVRVLSDSVAELESIRKKLAEKEEIWKLFYIY